MLPFIKIAGRPYPMYGIMGVIGFLSGLLYLSVRLRKNRKDFEDAIYIYTLSVVGAMAGAKLLYIVTVLPQFASDFPLISANPMLFARKYLSGGMVMYGGLLGGLLTACLVSRYFGRHLSEFVAILLPPLILLAAFGRIGCFCTGCCYGKETAASIGVIYPPQAIAPSGVRLLPVQLFEACFDFILFILFAVLGQKPQPKPYLLALYIALYSAFRFVIEFFRGDLARGIWFGLSTSQWIAAGAMIISIGYFIHRTAQLLKD